MPYPLDQEGEIGLKIGSGLCRVKYRRPSAGELIATLVKKMPRGNEAEDAQRILLANLELGKASITGVGEHDFTLAGKPLDFSAKDAQNRPAWIELIVELFPLLLIALGQFLSAAPALFEELSPKKSSGISGGSKAASSAPAGTAPSGRADT